MINRSNETGISLPEVMIVLAIISTLATMATPRLTGMLDRAEERQQIEEAISWVREARSIARSRQVQVSVSISGGHLIVDAEGYGATFHALGGTITHAWVTDNDDEGIVVFNDMGGADEVNPPTISFTQASGTRTALVVYPAIGTLREVGT